MDQLTEDVAATGTGPPMSGSGKKSLGASFCASSEVLGGGGKTRSTSSCAGPLSEGSSRRLCSIPPLLPRMTQISRVPSFSFKDSGLMNCCEGPYGKLVHGSETFAE